jgi:hypothetical protein
MPGAGDYAPAGKWAFGQDTVGEEKMVVRETEKPGKEGGGRREVKGCREGETRTDRDQSSRELLIDMIMS